jgi:hypothetical protein
MNQSKSFSSLGDSRRGFNPQSAIRNPQWMVLFLLILSVGFLANAQSTSDSDTTDYDSFQIIIQRNIFDPNRYPHTSHYHRESRGVPTFSLAGVMSYRKGLFAFFSGTSDDYQKVLQQGGTIAGYTVTNITFDGAQLLASGKTIDLKVGAAMRLEGSDWELSAPGNWGGESTTTETSSSGTSTAQPASESSTPPPSAGGPSSDILKRLMEQRQQQLK